MLAEVKKKAPFGWRMPTATFRIVDHNAEIRDLWTDYLPSKNNVMDVQTAIVKPLLDNLPATLTAVALIIEAVRRKRR